MQTEVKAANVSTCSLFSVLLLYKSIVLLFLLSSAIIPKLVTETLVIHSLDTADKIWKLCEQVGFLLRRSKITMKQIYTYSLLGPTKHLYTVNTAYTVLCFNYIMQYRTASYSQYTYWLR